MAILSIVVNYKSAPHTVEAVKSILNNKVPVRNDVVVVDNSEDPSEYNLLRASLTPEIKIITPERNIGFGAACNLAVERHKDEKYSAILLLNPDARLLSGSLARLYSTLFSQERIGAVYPKVYWDDEKKFILPPSLPGILIAMQYFFRVSGIWDTIVAPMVSRLWRCYALKVWKARKPVEVCNVSGGSVLVKKSAVDKLSFMFDPRFFLYFEDTDLFLRLKKKGYSLVWEPRAEAVHYYNQCDFSGWEQKKKLMHRSLMFFLEKHFSRMTRFIGKLNRLTDGWIKFNKRRFKSKYTEVMAPFVVPIHHCVVSNWLFEWSPSPDFIPSVGMFGKGENIEISSRYISMLAPGSYYGRVSVPTYQGKFVQSFCWKVF